MNKTKPATRAPPEHPNIMQLLSQRLLQYCYIHRPPLPAEAVGGIKEKEDEND